jgi:hypothetical protein
MPPDAIGIGGCIRGMRKMNRNDGNTKKIYKKTGWFFHPYWSSA